MITSKLTTKAQTTIPQAVRRHLALQPGDRLGYVLEGGHVRLMPAAAKPQGGAVAGGETVFEEWEGESDRRTFSGL
jgi:antitoxin PrlF